MSTCPRERTKGSLFLGMSLSSLELFQTSDIKRVDDWG